MLNAEQHMYKKQLNNRLTLLALWFMVVFILSQGLAWFHPHENRHFSVVVSQYCQIQFCDEASFCPHAHNIAIHLESSGNSNSSECHFCQQLIELSQYSFSILWLYSVDVAIIPTPFSPLPLTSVYLTARSERAPPSLFA